MRLHLMTTASVKSAPIHPRVLPYMGKERLSYDTETSSLWWWETTFRIGGHVLYHPDVGPTYIAVGHEGLWDNNEDGRWVADSIDRLFAEQPEVLVHNRVFDENVALTAGIHFPKKVVDTIGLWWCINSFTRSFALKRLGLQIDPQANAEEGRLANFIKGNKLQRYTQVPIEVITPYAEQDGRLTWGLWELGLRKLPEHQKEIHEVEQKWIGLMSRIARVGLPVDTELAQEIIDSHLYKAHQIRVRLAKATGIRGFNPGSGPQVQMAAQRMGVHLQSTEMAALWQSNLPKDIREGITDYRQYVHTVGSYFEPLIKISRNSRDGRAHASFRTTTATGRLAAGDPINLTGLPRKDTKGIHRVREVVRYTEESGLGRAYLDYAQIDVRLGTHYSQDQMMLDVMRDPEGDVHTMVMNEILAMGVNIDRPNSKRLVFGSQYGVGPDNFSITASGLDEEGNFHLISREQADRWLKAHRRRFPAFPMILSQVENTMKTRGFIWTWDGRMIICPEDMNPFSSFAWLVQSGGAQILKRSMIAADELLGAGGYKSVLALSVHDEIHVEGPLEELEETSAIVARCMAYVFPDCRVPLYVQPELGTPSWANKTPIGRRVPYDVEEWMAERRLRSDAARVTLSVGR